MVEIPDNREAPVSRIYRALEAAEEPRRGRRIGPSWLSDECHRRLWYRFRWCWDELPKTDGRMLRLFRRGHGAEGEIVSDLRAAGFEVEDRDDEGRQFWFFDFSGHMGGAIDGVVRGLSECPDKWHVLEIKTHNAKSWKAVAAKGVEIGKPEHYDQMQLYMAAGWTGLDRALYVAENKDTSELYAERVRRDPERIRELRQIAADVIEAAEPLPRLSDKPEHYGCKWCDFARVCHEGALPEPTCRNCVHVTPAMDRRARWVCERYGVDLAPENQEQGCSDHAYIPRLVPWPQQSASPAAGWISYQLPSGRELRNGPKADGVFGSLEIYAAQRGGSVEVLFDELVTECRERLDARVEP